ncbi:ATP synthase mitochondrial F1 complex assembly factor 1-like isoform X2 [Tigriopus californicus]|uniref:ATP synthase mitochondrial F1 complex assembly factor 1-like isoform X2 n=1 Tax=Tigriopus californicus TaxID=6832 RepID=UPI0027D9DE0D|nr:ATP synthase mitochondrial F1 complex assembly factor 1-like isoform X2 [Tigriopus californicus]
MSSPLFTWMLQSGRPLTTALLTRNYFWRNSASFLSTVPTSTNTGVVTDYRISTQRRLFHSSLVFLKDKNNKGNEGENMDDLQKNPYFDKYADKIAKMQKTSPEEFLNRLADFEQKKKRSPAPEGAESSLAKEFSLPTKPKRDISPGSVAAMTKEKKLNDRMKVDLLMDKTPEEIGKIWREFHLTKDSLSAVIPTDVYKQMAERFVEYKTFLFPLPRKQGYEFIVVQFLGNGAHFTTLINFQAHAENAPECLTLTHYTDLAEEKGIVLMVGEYDPNVLTIQEAQCLANQVEMYYCNPSQEKQDLMEKFVKKPNEFKHMDLVAQVETMALFTKQ